MSVATKIGKMVAYLEVLLTMKSHEPLITWSCEITWQTKTAISPLSQCLWPPNLVVVTHYAALLAKKSNGS